MPFVLKIVPLLFAVLMSIAGELSTDNLALGVPGKADTVIDRPGYALGYIEYHE